MSATEIVVTAVLHVHGTRITAARVHQPRFRSLPDAVAKLPPQPGEHGT